MRHADGEHQSGTMSDFGRALLAQLDPEDLASLRDALGLAGGAGSDSTDDGLLTVDEAAARARCHAETIRRAIRSHSLAATRVGSNWRVSASDLAAWLGRPRRRLAASRERAGRPRSRVVGSDRVSDAFAAARTAALS